MNNARPLASILFYLSRLLAIPYLLTSAYTAISFLLSSTLVHPIERGRFVINYPFTDQRFLIGDSYAFGYVFEMIAIIGLYGLFFWLLGNVFKTFREERLFTVAGVKRLRIFYLLNWGIPLLFLVVHVAIGYEVLTTITLAGLHFIVAIFAYFMAVIFSRGLSLQQEQDLIF